MYYPLLKRGILAAIHILFKLPHTPAQGDLVNSRVLLFQANFLVFFLDLLFYVWIIIFLFLFLPDYLSLRFFILLVYFFYSYTNNYLYIRSKRNFFLAKNLYFLEKIIKKRRKDNPKR